jgi:peptidoglycan/xylan/chitin deacetylase (PgdA/CDA1 family)
MFKIPIVAYHKITNQKEFGLTSINIKKFESQLKLLQSEGYATITFKQLAAGKAIPKKPIIITFDDGYHCIFENAIPLLEKYNFNAVIYLVVGYLGRINEWEAYAIQRRFKHINAAQISALNANGFEIASHTMNHPYLPACSIATLKSEVNDSKKRLQDIIGDSIISFCYPYGKFREKTVQMVREAGYLYATGNIMLGKCYRNNNYTLQRRSIYATDSNRSFLKKVKDPSGFNHSVISEWMIQRGALAAIWKKKFRAIF